MANGGLVFTVEKNGEYYRFVNETFGYLCSNGTGNNAFYQQEASEDADWVLAEYNGGYSMESRTAKFNGRYSQFLEYYAGAYMLMWARDTPLPSQWMQFLVCGSWQPPSMGRPLPAPWPMAYTRWRFPQPL